MQFRQILLKNVLFLHCSCDNILISLLLIFAYGCATQAFVKLVIHIKKKILTDVAARVFVFILNLE